MSREGDRGVVNRTGMVPPPSRHEQDRRGSASDRGDGQTNEANERELAKHRRDSFRSRRTASASPRPIQDADRRDSRDERAAQVLASPWPSGSRRPSWDGGPQAPAAQDLDERSPGVTSGQRILPGVRPRGWQVPSTTAPGQRWSRILDLARRPCRLLDTSPHEESMRCMMRAWGRSRRAWPC
jgi:hypothetical protein